MYQAATADIASARLEGARFGGNSFETAEIVSSFFETNRGFAAGEKATDFDFFGENCTFSDDTVLTAGIVEAILGGWPVWHNAHDELSNILRKWVLKYPDRGFGKFVKRWAHDPNAEPQGMGNGGAMRVAPIAIIFDEENKVRDYAKDSALATHVGSSAIKGTQAAALATFWARQKLSIPEIKDRLTREFGYNLDTNTDYLRSQVTEFSSDCDYTVPHAILAALESTSFEHAVRLATSIGGDTDTMAVIAAGIAKERFGYPDEMLEKTKARLPEEIIDLFDRFNAKYN